MTISADGYRDMHRISWLKDGELCRCGHGPAAHAHHRTGAVGPCGVRRGFNAALCGCDGWEPAWQVWRSSITLPLGVTPGGAL